MATFQTLDRSTADELRTIGTMITSGDHFTIAPSLLYLTDVERADIEAFRVRVKHIQQESEKRKLARAFRILDLPPEIRVRIYGYALLEENAGQRVLAVTVAPKVARVCKTFGAEALPLFFAETEFILPIGCNFEHRARHRKVVSRDYHSYAHQKRSGILNFKQPVKKAIREAGNDAIFRNVVLQVFETAFYSFNKRGMLYDSCVMEVKLSVSRGQLLIIATERGDHPSTSRKRRHAESQDVNIVIDEARRIARGLADTAEFKGLKLRDLERIVKAFRFTEPADRLGV